GESAGGQQTSADRDASDVRRVRQLRRPGKQATAGATDLGGIGQRGNSNGRRQEDGVTRERMGRTGQVVLHTHRRDIPKQAAGGRKSSEGCTTKSGVSVSDSCGGKGGGGKYSPHP